MLTKKTTKKTSFELHNEVRSKGMFISISSIDWLQIITDVLQLIIARVMNRISAYHSYYLVNLHQCYMLSITFYDHIKIPIRQHISENTKKKKKKKMPQPPQSA